MTIKITRPVLVMGTEVGYAILERQPDADFLAILDPVTYKIIEIKLHKEFK